MIKIDPLQKLNLLAESSLAEINVLISQHQSLISQHEITSNLKFIKEHEIHINVAFELFELIKPHGNIFEIGPGACYFLYLCKHINNCHIDGVDLESPLFSVIRKQLDIQINEAHVWAFRNIPFHQPQDYIVTFLTMFNSGWGVNAHKYWLSDCYNNLNDDGKLFIHFNRRTFHQEIKHIYHSIGKEIRELTFCITKQNLEEFKECRTQVCP